MSLRDMHWQGLASAARGTGGPYIAEGAAWGWRNDWDFSISTRNRR
jgi:hypothetical protein